MYWQSGKTLVKQEYPIYMSPQYGELRPTNGWDRFGSLEHPSKFQRVSRLRNVTARHSSSGVSQNLWRWTEGATYIRQGGHFVGQKALRMQTKWNSDVIQNAHVYLQMILCVILVFAGKYWSQQMNEHHKWLSLVWMLQCPSVYASLDSGPSQSYTTYAWMLFHHWNTKMQHIIAYMYSEFQ